MFYSLEGADVVEDLENGIDPYHTAIGKFDDHFSPKQHDSFERTEFCKLTPNIIPSGAREPLAKFLMRCTEQAKKCDFGKTEAESREFRIIDKIIYHAPAELREKLLQEETLTLAKVTRMVNSFESIKHQVKAIAGTGGNNGESVPAAVGIAEENVNQIYGFMKSGGGCFRCGQKNHFGNDRKCPAHGKPCEKCKKIGHFARVCRSTFKRKFGGSFNRSDKKARYEDVRTVDAVEEMEQEEHQSFIYNIGDGDEYLWVKIGDVLIRVLIDSGSTKNIIDDSTWEYMKAQGVKSWDPIGVPKTVLRGYGRDAKPLSVTHIFESFVSVDAVGYKARQVAVFYVVADGSQPLLGKETAMLLGVLTVGLPNAQVNQISEKRAFPKMKNVLLRIPINKDVTPVVQRARRPPIALLSRIEEKLSQLLTTDIIEPVSGGALWVSPLVTIIKDNGDLRLCVDMRRANQAIIREHHMMPTFEDFLPRFKSSTFFSRLDVKDAFHQVRKSSTKME